MITELSILIPSYNSIVEPTVRKLSILCERITMDAPQPFHYEIIVADDGSEQTEKVETNKAINSIPHCQFFVKERNSGSASTRNFLATKSQYEWLLFVDSDMEIPGMDFIMKYLPCDQTDVTNGGIKVGATWVTHCHNLRYLYEKKAEANHTSDRRQKAGFREFRSTNFIIRRSCILAHTFDERFQKSGYEDVMFGKTLQEIEATILHVDNPLILSDFENNENFMKKTEHNLATLHQFRLELKGYSRLIDCADGFLSFPIRLWHSVFGRLERRNLTSNHPRLWLYTLYRLGYYSSLKE